MGTKGEIIRKRLTVTGDVQGVGFRYRAYHAAASLGLTGWVRNEWNGTVMMEVQGTEQEIARMLEITEQGHFIHIEKIETEYRKVDEEERSFMIC